MAKLYGWTNQEVNTALDDAISALKYRAERLHDFGNQDCDNQASEHLRNARILADLKASGLFPEDQ